MNLRNVLLVLLAVLLGGCAAPRTRAHARLAAAPDARPLRVLFVGNSLTFYNDMPAIVQALSLADTGGRPMEVASVTHGGWTLEKHWDAGEALRAIRSTRWDFVVLQEYSTRPLTDRPGMFAAAQKFDAAIDASGAKPVLYLTWSLQGKPEQQAPITDAYTTLGREIDAAVAPVGEAWARARKLSPALNLYHLDGKHPSPAGSYLAACVLYRTLTGRPVTGIHAPLKVLKLTPQDTALLQTIATDTPSP